MRTVLGCPVGSPTHVKTRPEPEGFGVGSGRVRHFMGRVFSGRVPEGSTDFKFFRGSPKANEKTRIFSSSLYLSYASSFLHILGQYYFMHILKKSIFI